MVVSPYHLTTREAPAMAALQIASRVVTMLPTPFSGVSRRAVEGAARASPEYAELMESWRWSGGLWDAGVVAPHHEGFDAAEHVRGAFDRVAGDARYAALRPLMKPHVFESERDYLRAVAGDVLKGGPDPAISVPVAAGIDRFAARHGLAVARAHPTSVSQRAEARLGERLGSLAIPVLTQASGGRVLALRDVLAPELGDLRESMDGVLGAEGASDAGGAMRRVERAASAYTRAFESRRAELCREDDPDEVRAVASMVSIWIMRLPGGAVLESSLAAMRALGMREATLPGGAATRTGGGSPARAGGVATTLPALWDEHDAPVLSLVFKTLGRP